MKKKKRLTKEELKQTARVVAKELHLSFQKPYGVFMINLFIRGCASKLGRTDDEVGQKLREFKIIKDAK